jgi:hypothetical protein
MRKFILSLLILTSTVSYAQFRLGIFAGISNYQGDMVQGAFAVRFTKGAMGISGNYDISERVTLRGGFTFGKIEGDDKYNIESVKFRNLNFQSNLSEFSLIGEFNVFNLNNIKWSPYAFAGLAVFHFNPYTIDSVNDKVFLKPLSTEGQGIDGYDKPYSLTQVALPFGGGVKYNISDNVRVGLEIGFRKLFTDYLDDVSTNYADEADLLAARGQQAVDYAFRTDELRGSTQIYPAKGTQRGSAEQKDWYYFTGLHFTFALGDSNGGGFLRGKGGKKGFGCPSVPL